ncbi:MAG: recombinase RecT, partial [Dehalococcoidia bacterium]|nr:recombinase RecT [Dehalococcoidia bacterium]
MVSETLNEESRELTIYGTDRQMMTADIAEKIIQTIWPGSAPEVVTKAIMICAQNNLNPLMGDVFIVHYAGKSDKDVVVLGIDGNRKIARRKTPYEYVDGPRAMRADEIEATGENPKAVIGAVVVLQTPAGGRFPGYGFYGRDQSFLGADKGNTRFNMACLRAERAALKRLMPDNELPAPVGMVIDGVFADVSDVVVTSVGPVSRSTGEIAPNGGRCPVHNKPMKTGQYGPFCGTKLADGSWCKARPTPKPQETPAQPQGEAPAPAAGESPDAWRSGEPGDPIDAALEEHFGPADHAPEASKPDISANGLIALAKQLGWSSGQLLSRIRLKFQKPSTSLPNFSDDERQAMASELLDILA